MRKVLILTAGYGQGHISAARALQHAFQEHPGIEPELIDLFALHAPRLDTLSRHTYLRMINLAPQLWSAAYQWLDKSPRAPSIFSCLRGHRRLLARILEEKQPLAICSTYPAYGWLLDSIHRQSGFNHPTFTVVTDALTINSLWYRPPADGWFVTDRDSARCCGKKACHRIRLWSVGFRSRWPLRIGVRHPM